MGSERQRWKTFLGAREIGIWCAVCLGVWLASLSKVSGAELVIAGCSSLACAVAAASARRAVQGAWRFRARWFMSALTLPVRIVTDYITVLGTSLRGGEGQFVTLDIPQAKGATQRAAGKRALALFIVNVSPSSFVLDIDPSSGRSLAHVMSTDPHRLEKLVDG